MIIVVLEENLVQFKSQLSIDSWDFDFRVTLIKVVII